MLKPRVRFCRGREISYIFKVLLPWLMFTFLKKYLLITSVKGNFTIEKYSTHLHQMIQLTVFVSYWHCQKITTNFLAYNNTNILSYGSGVRNSDMGLTRLKSRCLLAKLFLSGSSVGEPFPCLLQLLEAPCIP